MQQACLYGNCYPEVTGTTDNPAGASCNQKLFSAGNRLSSNAISSRSNKVTKETVGTLDQEYTFELIPKTPVTVAAGYYDSLELHKKAAVWYGPTSDGHNFYYTAYSGNPQYPSDPNTKSSILSSVNSKTGKHNWTIDTLSLYPTSVQLANNLSVCRIAPAIYGDTLYLIDYVPQPQGPWIFAINKNTGAKKWAYPMFTEGWTPTRVGDMNIIATSINGKTNIYTGVSSLQNTTANQGTPGYPIYTDQGYIFRIEDRNTHAVEIGRVQTSAPLVKVGDVVTEDMLPPFDKRAGGGAVTQTVASDAVINPYVFGTDPDLIPIPTAFGAPLTSSIPIGYVVTAAPDTTLQPAWTLAGVGIYVRESTAVTPDPTPISAADLLLLLQDPANLGKTYFLTAYLDPSLSSDLQAQTGNNNLAYFRTFFLGDTLLTTADAQGFNYYGNSTWGAPVTVDGADQRVYFGTGQSHSLPFYEMAYYEIQARSFKAWQNRISISAQAYETEPTTANLNSLNELKDLFLLESKTESERLSIFSPRGMLSFSDAVICTDLSLNFKWGKRTLPMDHYVFDTSIYLYMTGYGQVVDGDVSAGVQLFREDCVGRKLLAVTPKSGLGCVFDHTEESNVTYRTCQYLAPASPLGGANYQCTQTLGRHILCNQANTPLFGSSQEVMVTREGEIIPTSTSFNVSLNVQTGVVEWNAPLEGPALAQTAGVNGVMLTSDLTGGLYGHDMLTGRRLWKFDTLQSAAPSNGGVASACVLTERIIWTPSYKAVEFGNGAQYGASYKTHRCKEVDFCDPTSSLTGKVYSTTYHSQLPSVVLSVLQKWEKKNKLLTTIFLNGQAVTIKYKYEDGIFVEKVRNPQNNQLVVSLSNLLVFSSLRYQLDLTVGETSWTAVFNLEEGSKDGKCCN